MSIYVNQTGYSAHGYKKATIIDSDSFSLYNAEGEEVLTGETTLSFEESSGDNAGVIDFSSVTKPGVYSFVDAEGNASSSFEIKADDYLSDTIVKCMRMFYFQRCGMALDKKYAGIYEHKICHAGLVDELRGDRKNIECSGGWHDAGDFGRYVTAGAVAVQHLLYAYKLMPEAFADSLNIPESGNGTPDILNECRYELEWLLKMQREDGAVYHKCTAMRHAPLIMPEDDHDQFFVTPVSSLAAGDVAGLFALASGIYAPFDKAFSERLENAAILSGKWLVENPDFLFENPEDVHTGSYYDMMDTDERFFAYIELYRLTGDKSYMDLAKECMNKLPDLTGLGWGFVPGFGSMTILTDDCFDKDLKDAVLSKWLASADEIVNAAANNPYGIGLPADRFGWGSNMTICTSGMKLGFAYILTGDEKYLECLNGYVDYIFGRNALGISYVTGIGEHHVNNVHNRPTIADGIDECIPGFLSGGPSHRPADETAKKMIPAGTASQKSFVDHEWAYSVNEITIYWNSPLVFCLAVLKKFAK